MSSHLSLTLSKTLSSTKKGFEMIAHINQYFHPSSTVNALGYIFQLIDIKLGANEPVITLKVQFSCLFASLPLKNSKKFYSKFIVSRNAY
jgi:hypothetical protein